MPIRGRLEPLGVMEPKIVTLGGEGSNLGWGNGKVEEGKEFGVGGQELVGTPRPTLKKPRVGHPAFPQADEFIFGDAEEEQRRKAAATQLRPLHKLRTARLRRAII